MKSFVGALLVAVLAFVFPTYNEALVSLHWTTTRSISFIGGRHSRCGKVGTAMISQEDRVASRRNSHTLNLFGNKKKKNEEAGEGDILNSPAFLKKKVDVLKGEIKSADEDIEVAEGELRAAEEEWGDQMRRLKGEFDFIKQRSFNEVSTLRRRSPAFQADPLLTDGFLLPSSIVFRKTRDASDVATVSVIKEVLQVVDNFNRAFSSIKCESDEAKAVEEDFRGAYDDIEGLFKELGVEEVETLGTEFDYECHEAVTQMPSEEYEEGLVCQEFQKGYRLKDTLIRPAMVAVAM